MLKAPATSLRFVLFKLLGAQKTFQNIRVSYSQCNSVPIWTLKTQKKIKKDDQQKG